jgi:hypothetical protein
VRYGTGSVWPVLGGIVLYEALGRAAVRMFFLGGGGGSWGEGVVNACVLECRC